MVVCVNPLPCSSFTTPDIVCAFIENEKKIRVKKTIANFLIINGFC
jgi:hypothetical protein